MTDLWPEGIPRGCEELYSVWPDGVPRGYTELFKKYGPFIASEVRRRNVVATNFEDLYQTVCERLVAAQVLPKFVRRVNGTIADVDLPPTITAEEICGRLFQNITFPAWRSKMWSYHKVFLIDLKGVVPQEGKTHGTIKRGKAVVSWVSWMPTPVSGGYGSPRAIYNTSDVLPIVECDYFRAPLGRTDGGFSSAAWPKRKIQPHHFMGYLARCVHHAWYNFCRTVKRKHKDRTGDSFPQFRSPDGDFDANWEDGLEDTETTTADIELAIDYRSVIETRVAMTEQQKGEITHLLKAGHSIIEAVRMCSSLAPDQKRVLLSVASG